MKTILALIIFTLTSAAQVPRIEMYIDGYKSKVITLDPDVFSFSPAGYLTVKALTVLPPGTRCERRIYSFDLHGERSITLPFAPADEPLVVLRRLVLEPGDYFVVGNRLDFPDIDPQGKLVVRYMALIPPGPDEVVAPASAPAPLNIPKALGPWLRSNLVTPVFDTKYLDCKSPEPKAPIYANWFEDGTRCFPTVDFK